MNKDTVVASVIGFSLGLVAAIGLWVVPRILPKNSAKTEPVQQQEVQESPTASETKTDFTIAKPVEGEISKTNSITVSGTAGGAQFILIAMPTKNLLVTPNANGEFSANVDLEEGVNTIAVTSIKDQQEETKEIKVYSFSENI